MSPKTPIWGPHTRHYTSNSFVVGPIRPGIGKGCIIQGCMGLVVGGRYITKSRSSCMKFCYGSANMNLAEKNNVESRYVEDGAVENTTSAKDSDSVLDEKIFYSAPRLLSASKRNMPWTPLGNGLHPAA